MININLTKEDGVNIDFTANVVYGESSGAGGGSTPDMTKYATKNYVDQEIDRVENDGMIYDIYDKWEEVLNTVFPVSITFGLTPASDEHKDSDTSVKATWTCKRKGANLTPTNVIIKKGSEIIYNDTPTSHTGFVTSNVGSIGTTTFTVQITADGITKDATANFTRILPILIGFGSNGKSVLDLTNSYTKKYIQTSLNLTDTEFNNPTEGNYLIIALPYNKTIKSISSGGFTVPITEGKIDETYIVKGSVCKYNIYYSSNPLKAGNINLTISAS